MSQLAGRPTLVTGGAGFLGSHLVDRLVEEGVERIVVVDNFFLGRAENLLAARALYGADLRIYREDAGDPNAMAEICNREQPEVVFNLATKPLKYSFFNPAGATRTSLDIALALVELLRRDAFGRLVQVSTSEVYGSAVQVPMTEDHPLRPLTPYAAGKAGADLLLDSYRETFGLNIQIIRPFNNYGPRQNDDDLAAVVPATIRRIQASEAPLIQGTGEQTRDFTYVSDTVEGIVRLAVLDDAKGLTVNLGSGRQTSIRELVHRVCSIMGYRGQITIGDPRPADVERHCADVSRATGLVGPIARTSLDDGLVQTVMWYEKSRGDAGAAAVQARDRI